MTTRFASLITAAILCLCGTAAAAQAQDQAPFSSLARGVAINARGPLDLRAGLLNRIHARSLAAGARSRTGPESGQAATIGVLPAVQVGNLPQDAAFDRATDTVYVANQNDNTVSVVDARRCNAQDTSGCGQTPVTVPVGAGPFAIAIDDRTNTVYVANQYDNTVSVIDGAACNATHTSGCSVTPPTVAAGPTPFGIAIDPRTDTLYVADANFDANGNPQAGSVSVINGATCNATVASGCGQQPASVPVGNFPFIPWFDRATETVYVTNANDNTLSMIDARTCNATDSAGCDHVETAGTDSTPIPVVVNDRTGTLYVGSANSPVVDVLDARTCNAARTSGCGVLGRVAIAGGTDGLAIDPATDTLFAANNGPGTSPAGERSLSVIDASRCNAHDTRGCGQQAPTALTGANPGGQTVDPATDTVYVPTFDNTLEVIDTATCNDDVQTGCGQPVPSTLAGKDPVSLAIDPATSSVYVGGAGAVEGFPWTITMLDDATCNTTDRTGCTPNPASFVTPFLPWHLAIDAPTDTLYATYSYDANFNANDTLGVIDTSHCSAIDSSGCDPSSTAITVGPAPQEAAIDHSTHTAYVTNSDGTVSVVDTSTCNAKQHAGCNQTPPAINLGTAGQFPESVAVDQATDTVYVWDLGTPSVPGAVSVIDGATCNATDHSGCANLPPAITIGNDFNGGFNGLGVNETTDTVYVVNTADDTVSVINGATCNATTMAGCDQTPATVAVGHQIFGALAVDRASDRIYVANGLDDTISVIDGSTCNGGDMAGCSQTPPTIPGGAQPAGLAVDPTDGIVYAADNGGGTASFFRFVTPDRPSGVTATRSGNTVKLSWNRAYDGGLPIIYQVVPSPTCLSCKGLSTPSTSGQPNTTVTGLAGGTTYTFKVRGADAAGTGPLSAASNNVGP